MPRRLWLSVAMLAVGTGLFATAQIANASGNSSRRYGGVFRVGLTGASTQIDPQLAYVTTTWWLEYATAAKLYNYPDKRGPAGSLLVPEVASGYRVSKDGKTYTFTIRKGFRFSNGEPVTAKSFQYAIDRTANHDLASPGVQFIEDPKGSNILGASEVTLGQAKHVIGVKTRGNKLMIRLTRPDGAFLSKITMPFFQATSAQLPLNHEVHGPYPSAGPYAFTQHEVNVFTAIGRNRYWKRGQGRMRPRSLSGLSIQWNLNEQTAFNQTKANQLDEAGLPAAEVQGVANQYGVNKTRFWSKPINCTGYLPLNMANHLFKNNLPLRQAVNYAINRKAYVAQAGAYAGQPWTHIFNPGVPGWRNVTLYKRNLAEARRLAAGHFRDGNVKVWYRGSGTINPAQAQIVRQDLINIGFKPGDITMVSVYGGLYDPPSKRGADFDIVVSGGWCSDYPDPQDWLNVLFYGKGIQAENNVNYSYMDLASWDKRFEAAARLVGPKRLKVYGQLDLDLMRKVAPVAVERTYNNRYFFSNRVDPKSLVYQGIYSDWSIPALALR
jgi:ABC-type transport system substrate-binding protein